MTEADKVEEQEIKAMREESALRWKRLLNRLRQRAYREKHNGNA